MYSIPASQRSDVASTAESVGSELARPAEREPVPQAAVSWSRRTRTLLGVQVLGTGSYVPETIVSNEDLKRERGFDPQWIEQRTGILARRHLPPHLATSDMCIAAARRALDRCNVRAEDIDLVVVGTFTPDYQCPTTANLVQSALGIDAPAFDLQAACSGFVYALATAAQFVATGNSHRALVIGADCNSRIVDQADQKIAPLFGDGAGAVVLGRGDAHQGLMCYQLGSDGSGGPMLDRPVGGTKSPLTAEDLAAGRHLLRMDGRNVFKWAVRAVVESIDRVLHQSGMRVEDVDLFVLHQANIRIINNVAEQLAIPPEKLFNNLARYGNTSAGSVPLALDEAVRGGRIGQGSTVLMAGFGAGLTWGTCLFNW
ncbi:MAG: ketoacyl-ACP synthase III [Planctomycetaceae bacterium]|jgi:3-oxoacyl-[acyl-carrier-protein] synthase-3|nr:ketoacyl-ACP synthase III [Planctomycetaceae bacterium]